MNQDPGLLETRRRSLEEEFFHRENQRLVENLRKMHRIEKSKEALAHASGITNDAILEKLLELGIQAETVAALALVPLVEVVWADGHLDEKERQAILAAADAGGLAREDLDYELLQSWLIRRPEPRLREAWRQYIEGLCEQLSEEERNALKADLLDRARAVAEASGGFLGLGSKVSQAEAGMLEELEKAFHSPPPGGGPGHPG